MQVTEVTHCSFNRDIYKFKLYRCKLNVYGVITNKFLLQVL